MPETGNYVVLQLLPDGAWGVVGTREAESQQAAVEAAFTATMPGTETFVAIPARSWKPKTITLRMVPDVEVTEGVPEPVAMKAEEPEPIVKGEDVKAKAAR